ncbi:HAMP domain-containing sensor histidine kinase [Streptomyces sp. NPDC046925]|uniref:HAMP domain-containing sensor histidine kinase n=1 Tax=Streptomyces sp. NPDC046925 TaxID=3155375 RepID=UPI0033FA43ED
MARDIPFRKSLLTRLLAVSVLVSVVSIAATAWLAAQTTSGAIRQEQGQVLADDARVYDELLGLAAAAPGWRDARKTVRELAKQTGRRIALTTQDRVVIADSRTEAGKGGKGGKGAAGAELPSKASAVVDPLAVDGALTAGGGRTDAEAGGQDRIDPRAVGPFRLPGTERKQLAKVAASVVACMNDLGVSARAVEGPSGRPRVEAPNDPSEILDSSCRNYELDMPTRTEKKALDRLNELTNACLRRGDAPPVKVGLDLTWWQSVGVFDRRSGRYIPTETGTPEEAIGGQSGAVPAVPGDAAAERLKPVPTSTPSAKPSETPPESPSESSSESSSESEVPVDPSGGVTRVGNEYDTRTAACVGSARREQLGSYVSAPALLFVTSSDGSRAAAARADANRGFSLSAANTTRLAGFSAGILAVTVAVTAFAATRLTRPLRALTAATQRMKAGGATEPVTARSAGSAGEIRQLADAFNDMAAHRKALEDQRQAMVSDVAHELRTPLSNIRGWLEAAEDGVVATDPELVTSLLEEAVLLQHIVNDLQDLAAADAGTLRLHREPVHASDVVDQVAAAHQAGAEAAGVQLSATTLGDPCFTADPLRLRQAIGNLVSNAIRHTPEGGSVTISCRATLDAVVVEVADTGSGIAAADLPHVFDRFWRADKSRTRATGGSGLGLAIVRQLVEGHGGTVTARSTPGEGAVFTVRVPSGEGQGEGEGEGGGEVGGG